MWKFIRTWLKRARDTEGVLAFVDYMYRLAISLGLGTLMAWLSSEIGGFWQAFGWFGVVGVGILTWFLVVLGLYLLTRRAVMKNLPIRNEVSPDEKLDQLKQIGPAFQEDPAFLTRTILIHETAVWLRKIEGELLFIKADMYFFNGSGFPVLLLGDTRGSAILHSPLPHPVEIAGIPVEPIGYPGYGSFSVWLKLPRSMVQHAISVAESPESQAISQALQLPHKNTYGVILEGVSVKFEALTASGPIQFFARLPHSIEVSYPGREKNSLAFDSQGLYAGNIEVTADDAQTKLWIHIYCFNATQSELVHPAVDGAVTFFSHGSAWLEIMDYDLPLPIARLGDQDNRLHNGKEFKLVLEQSLPYDAGDFFQTISGDREAGLNLEKLEIKFASRSNPENIATLRLWDSIGLMRNPNGLFVKKRGSAGRAPNR